MWQIEMKISKVKIVKIAIWKNKTTEFSDFRKMKLHVGKVEMEHNQI